MWSTAALASEGSCSLQFPADSLEDVKNESIVDGTVLSRSPLVVFDCSAGYSNESQSHIDHRKPPLSDYNV